MAVNWSKAMYINSVGDLFIQLRADGCYILKDDVAYVRLGEYIAHGDLFRRTKAGIVLRNWEVEHEHFFAIPE